MFYDLKSDEFLTIIKKMSKTKISLTGLDEWEKYFTSYKDQIHDIQDKIMSTDEKLDNIIYGVYKITEKEKSVIEQTVRTTQTKVSFDTSEDN